MGLISRRRTHRVRLVGTGHDTGSIERDCSDEKREWETDPEDTKQPLGTPRTASSLIRDMGDVVFMCNADRQSSVVHQTGLDASRKRSGTKYPQARVVAARASSLYIAVISQDGSATGPKYSYATDHLRSYHTYENEKE